MENKINERMSSINAPLVDSTDTRVSDLTEASNSNAKLSNEPQSLTCVSSSVRNFGNGGALIHGLNSSGDGTVFKDCNLLHGPLATKHFYDRGGDFLKCDTVPWDFVKVQRSNVATPESLSGTSGSLSSTTGACKFIKDEKEPSVIMDTRCPSFDASSEIFSLNTCCDTDRKPQQQQQQQLGLSDCESTSFRSTSAGPRPGLEGSPNFLVDLNQPEQLSQVRTDSRCSLTGKTVVNFDAHAYAASQQAMYKNEVSRWQLQTTSAEPHYWCQSSGLTEDPFTHSGYDGNQNQAMSQRNPSPYSPFPG